MHFSFWRQLTLALLALWCSTHVQAGCAITADHHQASFGHVSALAIAQSPQVAHVSDAGLTCEGAVWNTLDTDSRIETTISSAHQGLLTREGSQDAIPYQLYADPTQIHDITRDTPFNYFDAGLFDLLGLKGSVHTLPLFLRTRVSDNSIAPGTYTDQLTVQWHWNVCHDTSASGCQKRDIGSGTSLIYLHLEVASDCAIAAPDLEFGTAPLVAGFSPVTQTLSVRCSKNTPYTVGLNEGLHAVDHQRHMASGTHTLAYEIYKGTGGYERWGNVGNQRRNADTAELAPHQFDGVTAQGFVYHADVLRTQQTPPAGRYSDGIIVDIIF